MKNSVRALMLVAMLVILQACATANVNVSRKAPEVQPKFDRISVPPFINAVGNDLPATAPENVAGAIIATIQKDHPGIFKEVKSSPVKDSSELVLQGKIIKYDPGSKAARFILIGLGAGNLELDIAIIDGASGNVIEQFSTSGSIMAGGSVGASMGIEDMIQSAAIKIVERLVPYGSGMTTTTSRN